MEKKISYLNRTYKDYKDALIDYSKKYFPNLSTDFDDASVGAWMIDLNAEIGDNLSYYIDRAFQETNINSAFEKSSVYALARNNNLKIPGPKGAMVEVAFSCYLPLSEGGNVKGVKEPDWDYAPIIKRGTRVSSSNQSFELLYDVDFNEQFNDDGISDRTITPIKDSRGNLIRYQITKLAIVVAGETHVFRKEIYSRDIKPFMELIIPAENVMNIESIVMKDGNMLQSYPTYGEFYMPNETSETYPNIVRYFEADYLLQQTRWGEKEDGGEAERVEYSYLDENGDYRPMYYITRGEWKPLKHKFITEYTDKGYLKVIFGAGINPATEIDIENASSFSKYMISKIIRNDNMGILPQPDTTLFILYRTGGGTASNLAAGAVNSISSLRIEIPCTTTNMTASKREMVRRSITVKSTSPSVSGKDMPTAEEIKYMIKYNYGAQDRCVTTKDYIDRILKLPPKYGTPFRVGVSEENNKIMIYVLGLDYNGKLDPSLPLALSMNIQNYLSEYRMINDFVEIKAGRIVNLSFEVDVHIDLNYNETDVKDAIIDLIEQYMDVNKHFMGDDIYLGDLEKEINKLDGVKNLSELRVYNEVGEGYSNTLIAQELVSFDECSTNEQVGYQEKDRYRVDLNASEKIIYSDGDTMLEIKYPNKDIKIRIKKI